MERFLALHGGPKNRLRGKRAYSPARADREPEKIEVGLFAAQ
jgi:hypothetical protein